MSLPFISAKCITYGRVDTLEESIYSFINQNYQGKKEMIIVNDYPLQKLEFDHPDVKIYNLDYTFETIGAKENFAMSKCSADIICQWDDDDVAMPNHLENVAKYFTEDADLLHWDKGILFNNDDISAIGGLGNSGIVFSRRAWELVGGYAHENAGYDMTFVVDIRNVSKNIVVASPPDNEASWFYIWAGRSYHMSGLGRDDESRPNVIKRHSEYIEHLRQRNEIPTGIVKLDPKWRRDYKDLLNKYLENYGVGIENYKKNKVLVTTASFSSGLYSSWIPQKSNKYEIVYNRVSADTESERPKAMHPRLRAKIPKMIVWEDHPGYDYYIWLDSRFSISDETAIEKLVDECLDVDSCFFKHVARTSVEQELDFVVSLMKTGNEYLLDRYDQERMEEQVTEYKKDDTWNDDILFECGIFIYSKDVIADKNYNLMKEWFYHNCIWSVQDQLSLPYLIHKFNIKYKVLDGNVYSNNYFK